MGNIFGAPLAILTANAWMQHPVGYRIVRRKALIDQLEARREELLRRLGHGS